MTIEQITQSSATMYSGATSGNKSNKTEADSGNGTAKQNSVEDTVALSPAALKALKFSAITERVPASVTEELQSRLVDVKGPESESNVLKKAAIGREYARQEAAFLDKQSDERKAIFNKWNAETGGLFKGTGFSTNDLSNITTTSGKPHPFAKQIGDYLRSHPDDLARLESLRTEKFPSYDEWKAQNG